MYTAWNILSRYGEGRSWICYAWKPTKVLYVTGLKFAVAAADSTGEGNRGIFLIKLWLLPVKEELIIRTHQMSHIQYVIWNMVLYTGCSMTESFPFVWVGAQKSEMHWLVYSQWLWSKPSSVFCPHQRTTNPVIPPEQYWWMFLSHWIFMTLRCYPGGGRNIASLFKFRNNLI